MLVNLHGPIQNTGYAIVATNLLEAINEENDQPILFPIGQVLPPDAYYVDSIQQSINNRTLYNRDNLTIKVWHEHSLFETVFTKGPYIAYPFFERNSLDNLRISSLKTPDIICVASNWAKKIIDKYLNTKIIIAPCGVNTNLFYPSNNSNETTRFLHVGKLEIRKGIDIIGDAFCAAFNKNDNVELIMSVHNPFLTQSEYQEWVQYYKKLPLGDKISFVGPHKTCTDVAKLMRGVDCGLFPSRAEGANLPALEMMACGKHIIITNYSAHTEYCNDENSLLINIDNLEPAEDSRWFFGDTEWAHIGQNQIDQLINHMRNIYKRKKEGLGYNEGGIETSKKLSWKNTWKKIKENI